jgi:hypothetical protein
MNSQLIGTTWENRFCICYTLLFATLLQIIHIFYDIKRSDGSQSQVIVSYNQ